MSDDIVPTETDYKVAYDGLMLHMQATSINERYDSFADAMYRTGMQEFIEHQAEVLAYKEANIRRLYNIINKDLNEDN